MPTQRVLLIGGGHSHVEVLRRFARERDAAIALTLVSPEAMTPYSGMLPGLVAGHYTHAEAHIDLVLLARNAGAHFLRRCVIGLDPVARSALLDDGGVLHWEIASIDIGATPDSAIPGACDHGIGVKPVAEFLRRWDEMQDDAARGVIRRVAVVGGGAGGVEKLLAMQYMMIRRCRDRAPDFHLVTDLPELLPQHGRAARRLAQVLVERDVAIHFNSAVVEVRPGALLTRDGRTIAADRSVIATRARPAPWLRESGLACDPRGFVEVDDHLHSTSHPAVFAAGDCATQRRHPRPKSGVYAVRQGPPLAANLRAAVRGWPLQRHVPQRGALALISTGNRYAIASRGPFVLSGAWVWNWKDRIDRAFMARYR
jgi:selenide,water dikinase